ncbi:hypothetical protein K431DRAFT_18051 [Polychaeton citri CBS 116435]|uniref:Uncharacterized protein n=1 Tax=Polychaeton citri CBS 116435 TaxID=1314669 RepID=A0A9P4UI51_9PEZI|nr:hypothetical protein K431DRAFT_18051 [Polychaeton citri CBS 116435]
MEMGGEARNGQKGRRRKVVGIDFRPEIVVAAENAWRGRSDVSPNTLRCAMCPSGLCCCCCCCCLLLRWMGGGEGDAICQ